LGHSRSRSGKLASAATLGRKSRLFTPKRNKGRAMIFRQLFDAQSSTYTYLLADDTTGDAILIDPVFEQVRREIALIDELNLKLRYSVETHVHADHVTGAWLLKEKLSCKIALSAQSGADGADVYIKPGDRIA